MLDKPIIKLSSEFDETLRELEANSHSFFITGRAGTGKSTLLQTFRNSTKKKTVVLAPTGIAALNVQGQTIHSFFGFPPRYLQKIDIKPRRSKVYKELELIIIDEISMVRADMLDNIDFFLRMNGKHPDRPFGGIQMVFFGDLFQLPPVVSTPEEQQIFRTIYQSPYFFSADVFKELSLQTITLNTIYRQTDKHFIKLLDYIRSAQVDEEVLETLNERYEKDATDDNEAQFITLATRNQTVDDLNRKYLNALTTPTLTFVGNTSGEFNEKLCPADLILQLKEGAQVMFVKNDKDKKYVNGTLGTVVELDENKIQVWVQDADGRGRTVEVEKTSWETIRYVINEKGELAAETTGSFKQYPLKLAWAMTIHKSQGKTFDHIIIDLAGGAFEHGQTYVALSRCRTLQGIKLKNKLLPRDIILDPRVVDFFENKMR